MVNKGELNDVLSGISPEMIQNFSSMLSHNNTNPNMNSNTNTSSDAQSNGSFNGNSIPNSNTHSTGNANGNSNGNFNNFDFSQIDMNTILKMKSVMDKLNSSNDPRSNLLYSLKPYLREEKKGKLDQYANLLNVAKIADLWKDNNKENPHNG